jgi:hypothetical protein
LGFPSSFGDRQKVEKPSPLSINQTRVPFSRWLVGRHPKQAHSASRYIISFYGFFYFLKNCFFPGMKIPDQQKCRANENLGELEEKKIHS